MNILETFSNNPYFHLKVFPAGTIVFDEGDINTCLYIVKSGKLAIEKYTTSARQEVKHLSFLQEGSIFGEGSISGKEPKEVRVKTQTQVEAYCIDIPSGMEDCIMKFPHETLQLLEYIIELTNKRLLLANREITVNHELQKNISQLEKIDMKHIFLLLDKLTHIFGCDYIIYIEKSLIVEHMILIRYDTREPGKLQDMAIHFPTDFAQDILEKHGINLRSYTLVQKIMLGETILGYVVFGNTEKGFDESDRRIAQSIVNGLVGIVRQEKLLKEERDKIYMKSM